MVMEWMHVIKWYLDFGPIGNMLLDINWGQHVGDNDTASSTHLPWRTPKIERIWERRMNAESTFYGATRSLNSGYSILWISGEWYKRYVNHPIPHTVYLCNWFGCLTFSSIVYFSLSTFKSQRKIKSCGINEGQSSHNTTCVGYCINLEKDTVLERRKSSHSSSKFQSFYPVRSSIF